MFLKIIKEAEDSGFYELHESLTHINKKITKSGGMFEDGTVDLCLFSRIFYFETSNRIKRKAIRIKTN